MEVSEESTLVGVPASVGLAIEYGQFRVGGDVLMWLEVDTPVSAELKGVVVGPPDPFIGMCENTEALSARAKMGHMPQYVPLGVKLKGVGLCGLGGNMRKRHGRGGGFGVYDASVEAKEEAVPSRVQGKASK